MVTKDPTQEWEVTSEGNQYLLVLHGDGLSVARKDSDDATQLNWDSLSSVTFPTGFSAQLNTVGGEVLTFGFVAGSLQREFRAALESTPRGAADTTIEPRSGPSTRPKIGPDFITTLPGFPGHVIVRVHGVVTELTSSSGWTASSKGNIALNAAMNNLRRSAEAMSANAVVGLSAALLR